MAASHWAAAVGRNTGNAAVLWNAASFFAGLDPEIRYTVTVIGLAEAPGTTERAPAGWIKAGGITLSGRTLATIGLEAGLAAAAAACAALALGTAILGHELLSRWTMAAIGLPAALMLGILQSARPPVAWLAAAFFAAAMAHTIVRGRRSV